MPMMMDSHDEELRREAAEYHFATWQELTEREKSEARFRGFPMDAVFTVKRRYGENENALVRWNRGTPQRDANGIIRAIGNR